MRPRTGKKKKAVKKKRPRAVPLEEALRRLKVPDDWDMLMVGDGSGCGWDIGAGWAVACIERDQPKPKVCYGAMNPGTVNIAELMPYIHGLSWYVEELRKRKAPTEIRVVRIITDSTHTQQRGDKPDKVLGKKNSGFWGAFNALERQGLVIHWHHFHRNTLALNSFTDCVSRAARVALRDAKVVQQGEHEFGPVNKVSPRE